MMMPYLQKRIELLMPWYMLINSNDINFIETLSPDNTNQIFCLSSSSARSIAEIYTVRHEFVLQKSIVYKLLLTPKDMKGKMRM